MISISLSNGKTSIYKIMRSSLWKKLLHGTKATTIEEQLVVFFFTLGHNAVNRQV